MKKIGIDARLYFQTGVGVYLRNFLHYLQHHSLLDLQFYIYVLKEDAKHIEFSNTRFIKREVTSRWHTFSEQFTFYNDLRKDNLDLMHFTYFSYPVLYNRKFIATIHDVTPRIFKTGRASTRNPLVFNVKHRVFKFVLTSQVYNATKIITPTETVKNQIIEMYGEKMSDKIVPIYEGVDYALTQTEENSELAERYSHKYFLYVGNFYPHKNVERLIEAFKDIEDDIQLILVGPNNYFSERIKYNLKKDKVSNIHLYHNARTTDLVYFYKHALALINPSLSEGFGLPLIEAAHFNLPILASNLAVFKELFSDRYISFDPKDVGAIRESIRSFLRERPKVDYSGMKEKYSFKKMTDEIVELYKKV